ncbi:MAG: FHA domain-containing protein [Chloroflexota bacterium]
MDDINKPETVPEREIKTERLDTGQFNPELREKLKSLKNTYTSGGRKLVLHFPVQTNPVVLEVKDIITLGRLDLKNNIHPTLDLGDYHGKVLGVSRFHAQITLVNDVFHIKDMGSTNGTRINDKKIPPYRLVPFNSGDTLRFGHLNVIVG